MITLLEKNRKIVKKILIGVGVVVTLALIVLFSRWLSSRNVNSMVESVRQEFKAQHIEDIKHVGAIEQKLIDLQEEFKKTKTSIGQKRSRSKGEHDNVFGSADEDEMAKYFDSSLDCVVILDDSGNG